MGIFFEDIKIGEKHTSSGRTITETDIVSFAGLSGDYNPLHVDKEYAEKSLFNQRIAHGALTFAVMTGFWDQLGFLRETVIAFYGVDRMRFIRPVFIGDTIYLELEFTEKLDKGKNGLVAIQNTVFNQKHEEVMACRSLLLVKKKMQQV
ncbi:MAG: MaoC family dehydratase N-terminal domain-containing protein [Theionarchaea archaeon]|nr:MaoC family dehydratase N-terminal domain-containing protein [Theionarchaea archaeon]